VNVGFALRHSCDRNRRLIGFRFGFLDAVPLVGLPVFFDIYGVVFLDIEGVMKAELILAGAIIDDAADPEAIRELVEVDVIHLEGDVHVLALPAGVTHVVLLSLDTSVGIAGNEIPRLDDVGEMPEIVQTLGNEADRLATALPLGPLPNVHWWPFAAFA
jgi:hypothetical protein